MSGCALREAGPISELTGGTELSVYKPGSTQNNDVMVMCLAHKGPDWAVLPAGWTLVVRNISGTTRAEMYWKRASSEPSSYFITGLADTGLLGIITYTGLKATGTVVDVTTSRANAAGTTGAPGIMPTVPGGFYIHMEAAAQSFSLGQPYIDTGGTVDYSLYAKNYDTPRDRLQQYTTSGTDIGFRVTDAMYHQPQPPILAYTWSGTHNQNVNLVAWFLPEPVNVSAPARYYLTAFKPNVFFRDSLKGTWLCEAVGPTEYGDRHDTSELRRSKTGGGGWARIDLTTNAQIGAICLARFVTPQLTAQTLSGYSLTLCNMSEVTYNTPSFVSYAKARYKLHVYVSQGNSAAVRTVLIDNYLTLTDVPSGDFPSSIQFTEHLIPLPSTVTILEGDRVVIELGMHVYDAPPPIADYVPQTQSHYTEASITRGCTLRGGPSGIAYPDGYAGFQLDGAPWLQFSGPLTEQVYVAPTVTHTTCATAQAITAIPFKVRAVDTSQGAGYNRAVWYRWTADRTARMVVQCWGSAYRTDVFVFTDEFTDGTRGECGKWKAGDQLDPGPDGDQSRILFQYNSNTGSRTCGHINVVEGRTYWFHVLNFTLYGMASNTGGLLNFELCPWEVFQPGDIFYVCGGLVTAWRYGQIVGVMWEAVSQTLSGVAIDYTKRPVKNTNEPGDPIHAEERLLFAVFTQWGAYVYLIDLQTLNAGHAQIDYIIDAFEPNFFHASTIEVNEAGEVFVGSFGDGFHLVADTAAAYENTVSRPAYCRIQKIDATHGDSQDGAPWPLATNYGATLDKGGTEYVRLRDAAGTIAYSSSGHYVPLAGTTVFQYDTINALQEANPVPTLTPGTGPNPGPKGIEPLPDGGILVCNGSSVQRYDAAGAFVRSYDPAPAIRATSLIDVGLDIDRQHFWTVDGNSAQFFRFNLATGTQTHTFETNLARGSSTSFVIYNPARFLPPPPGDPRMPGGPKMHYYGYAWQPKTTATPLGLVPKSRLDIYHTTETVHQTLGVKEESSQPLGNPLVADRDAYFSMYVVPYPIDQIHDVPSGRLTRKDVLVLDPRVGDIEQRVAALFITRAGGV